MTRKNRLLPIALAIALVIVLCVVGLNYMANDNTGTEAPATDNRAWAHPWYSTGSIASLDSSAKTFSMTIEDESKERLGEQLLEVHYDNGTRLIQGGQDDLSEGMTVTVCYLTRLNDNYVDALTIEILQDGQVLSEGLWRPATI